MTSKRCLEKGRSPMASAIGALTILPMKTAGTEHFIERTYREGGAFQWVRETAMNAVEADAFRIEFGVEWQAVEQFGVYRRRASA